jgi:hypothetical protein
MWKDTEEADRQQMTMRRMRIACWIAKATNTHAEYVIIGFFPLQQWLHEHASTLYVMATLRAVGFSTCFSP